MEDSCLRVETCRVLGALSHLWLDLKNQSFLRLEGRAGILADGSGAVEKRSPPFAGFIKAGEVSCREDAAERALIRASLHASDTEARD